MACPSVAKLLAFSVIRDVAGRPYGDKQVQRLVSLLGVMTDVADLLHLSPFQASCRRPAAPFLSGPLSCATEAARSNTGSTTGGGGGGCRADSI